MFSSIWPNKSPTNDEKKSPQQPSVREAKAKDQQSLEDTLPVPLVALIFFGLGFACSTGGTLLYARYGRRIKTTDWIVPAHFGERRWIRGVVTSVGDADNFRFFHTPVLGGWFWPLKWRKVPTMNKELVNQTLHVRIAGVDAPECGHFGKPGQPYADESLTWLRRKILGKVVYCQLLRRDQYQRVVSNVRLAPRFLPGTFFLLSRKNLALEMLRAGCATTYEQAGAEYGKEGKEEYLRVEKEARIARRGMWTKGVTKETPADYKRRYGSTSPKSIISKRTPRLFG